MITREAWGAKSRTEALSELVRKDGWALHWAGGTLGSFAHEQCARRVKGIQHFHMTSDQVRKGGAADIAYNFVVCPHGSVFEGRGYKYRSAANGTIEGNKFYLAILYLGGEGDEFTTAAKDAIAGLVNSDPVFPHSKFFNTSCPGDEIREWIAAGLPARDSKIVTATTTPETAEEDMPRPDDIVSEYRWNPTPEFPRGAVVRLLRNGHIRCYRLPYTGGINTIPPAGRLNWTEGDGVLFPVEPKDPRRGYEVRDVDDNMIAEFTPEWWAANKS